MLVYLNFQKDFEDIVVANLKAAGSKASNTINPARALAMLLDNGARQVAAGKYKVHLSEELLARPEWLLYQGEIADIIKRLEKGEAITHCLSETSAKVEHLDRLLAYWGINHLHPVFDGARRKKFPSIAKSRSGHLLYFRIHSDEIYFIDLLPHPPKGAPEEWIDAHLVRVADRHWPHLHRLVDAHPTASSKLTDDQHKTIFAKGGNAMVTTERGLVMPAGGLMSGGTSSVESYVQWGRMVRRLAAVQAYVREHHLVLFPHSNGWVRHLSLIEVDAGGSRFHVFDRLTEAAKVLSMP